MDDTSEHAPGARVRTDATSEALVELRRENRPEEQAGDRDEERARPGIPVVASIAKPIARPVRTTATEYSDVMTSIAPAAKTKLARSSAALIALESVGTRRCSRS